MEKKKELKVMGNKGFSLVELIIVIAIMAILVGVLAPQLLKYVERSRQAADWQVADTIRTAVVTSLLDPAVTDAPASANYANIGDLYGGPAGFVGEVKKVLNNETEANLNARLKSKAYKGQAIKIDIAANKVTVTVTTTDANLGPNIVIE